MSAVGSSEGMSGENRKSENIICPESELYGIKAKTTMWLIFIGRNKHSGSFIEKSNLAGCSHVLCLGIWSMYDSFDRKSILSCLAGIPEEAWKLKLLWALATVTIELPLLLATTWDARKWLSCFWEHNLIALYFNERHFMNKGIRLPCCSVWYHI